MEDPKVIYLGPACQKEGDGREWCEDDVWPQCECGCSSVRYMLEADARSELAIWKTKACESADREAALREERAKYKAGAELDALGIQFEQRRAQNLQQSLAAAEQRNTAMSKLLQRCIPVCRYKGSHTERKLINEIETVLAQPTEAGASE